MSSCLLSALLSQCSDIENVLDTLCWPSCSWPEIEKVESLSTLIVELIKESNSSLVFKDFKTKERFVCKVQSIIWDQCVPLLKMISNANLSSREGGDAQNAKNKEMLNAVCGLLGLCVRQSQADSLEKMSSIVLPVLTSSESDERSADSDQLDIDIAIEVMAVLLSGISQNAALTMESLSCTLTSIKELSDARVSKIIVRIWLTSLKSSTLERREEILHRVWEDLLSWHDRENTEVVTARVLLCLTAFSDYLFPLDRQLLKAQQHHLRPDPRTSQQFFRVVQTGLTHRDGVSRKRALYLLKKCVSLSEEVNVNVCVCEPDDVLFRWTPDQRLVYREFWEDYALVLETLEENQIHVVRPVLHRIDALAKATAPDAAADGALVHPSWLLCVYERMFHSENKAVMKDGVNHLLGLHLLQCPAFALSVSKFVAGPFMDVLTETSLYHRSPGQAVGECPELGLKLQNFMVKIFSSLPEENRGSVLLQVLKRLASPHWCAVPLFFLSQALSGLSPCPLLRGEGLCVLREVLRCTMITHQVLLRGATQCLLLHTAICLTDVAAVSLEEVFAFLVHFRTDESLHRGTTLWTKLHDWLVANEAKFQPVEVGAPPPGLSAYTSEFLQAFLTVSASSADQAEGIPAATGEAEVAARAILLSADAEGGGLERLLRPLLDVLRRLATSAYLPPQKSDRSLQVALRLLQLVGTSSEKQAERDKVAVALRRQLLSVVEPVQEFILRRLNGELQELRDFDRAALYHSLLGELVKTYCSVPGYLSNLQKDYVPKLTENCLRILNASAEQTPSFAGQVQKAVSMATLALLCELADQRLFDLQCDSTSALRSLWTFFGPSPSSPSSTTCFTQTLQKPLSTTEISELSGPDNNSLPLRDWGRLAARYVRDQWTCLSFLHRRGSVPAEMGGAQWSSASIAAATEALVLLPGRLALPALDFIRMVLPQVAPHEDSLCAEAVAASWCLVQASSTNSHDFWPTLQAFVRLAFQRSTLELTEAQSPELVPRLRQVTGEMMELAQVKSGVLNELIQHCSRIWLPSETDPSTDSEALRGALNHLDVLSEACMYGPVFRRDQRIIQEVQTYVEQLGEECAANTLIGSAPRDDQYPRVCALALLNRLDAGEELQNSLMEQLVERLLGKDEKISKSKVRYYSNSMQHRVKNRVWQIVLVLLPKLRPGFVADCVLPAALHAASCSNQASVKYLVEWAIILILHLWPNLIPHLWDSFSADHEKTKTSICTLLSVLVHLGVVLPQLENEAEQWQKAVELALLQCFSHIFTVRLYALLALKRLWALQARDGAAPGAQPDGLSSAVRACLQQAEITQGTGNALKNWSKIQEHFFFSVFHPLNDYSVETIFHTFPSLSGLADDEWVPVWKFEKLVDFRCDSSLPLRNPGRALSQLQPGDWVQQDQGELEQETRWADVQKKIAPWRLSVQEQEPELMAQQRAARLGKLTGALLVVASLIDKPTNLGGLCRTCEIFGASALVLDSLRHISDKQFQALSVSSELWLPLLEVKPLELADFLQLKKKVGYCIVGVEQTANSQSLQDYRFPEKTLLLLGNEREGIPANLLQLLDVCVEIPQQGVTRSLNVHVSAALLVWEYTKQHPGSGRAT